MDLQFEKGGVTFRARTEYDEDHGTPWENEDGHGPVSDWTRRKKLPGEIVLAEDRGSYRYYDYAEACKIARKEAWGYLPGTLKTELLPWGDWRAYVVPERFADRGKPALEAIATDINAAIRAVYAAHCATMTKRQYAAAAAMADYDRLRQWCNGGWHYVGVVVESLDEDEDVIDSASLWGIESDCGDYLEKVAQELAEDLLAA